MATYKKSTQVPVGAVNQSDFLGSLNLLQPNGFRLIIDRRNFSNLEFFAQSVMHPSISVTPAELPFRKVASVPFAADKLTFGELSANVLVDEEMNSYTEMYNWVNRIVNDVNINPSARNDDNIPIFADITLAILNSSNNVVRTIKYYECIPTLLGDISLETATADVSAVTFPVSFRYSYFEL